MLIKTLSLITTIKNGIQKKQPAIIIAISLTILFIGLHIFQKTPQQLFTSNTQPAQIDYFLSDFKAKIFKENGQLDYQLQGSQLQHYKNSDHVYIQDITMQHQQQDGWKLSAQQALTSENLQGDITFTGQAHITHTSDNPLSIQAHSFLFQKQNKTFIATNMKETVMIEWAQGTIYGSVLVANLDSDQVTLQNVHAQYTPNSSNN